MGENIMIRDKTFQKVYYRVNDFIVNFPDHQFDSRIGACRECINLSYRVEDITSYKFTDENIDRIDYDYAETFWQFMLSGATNSGDIFDQWPAVKKFTELKSDSVLPPNFNTFYGPRIKAQLPGVLKELTDNRESRRAVIHVLDSGDQVLLDSDETLEYACTLNMVYAIRNDKLISTVNMRSQNTAVVMQLDVYLQAKLALHIAEALGVKPGPMYCNMASAHVYERDVDYVYNILDRFRGGK